jgi:hypothetical protein
MTQRAGLPDLDTLNPEALKALIVAQHEQLLHKDEQLTSRDEEIERLKLLIAKLRRMEFGRKSETLDWEIEQLELKLDELEASRAQQTAASPSPMVESAVNRATKRARMLLPAHLPRETHKILPKQEACPDCGGALKPLGEDVSEILERVPEHFKVIRQVRPKLACAGCDKIVQAEAPSRPIERGIAGPGLPGPCVGLKICGSFTVVSPGGDLCAGGRGAGSFDHGGVGWGLQPVTGTIGRDVATSRDERGETAHRRHTCAGAGTGSWQNQNGTLVDLRAGRSAVGRCDSARRVVRLFAGS